MPSKVRNAYPVVTLAISVIAGLAFVVRAVKPYLPPDPPNRLQYETSEYLLQGSRQQVDWWPYGPEGFAEAKKLGKPVLLLIGAKWSQFGRFADAEVFHDSDVEAALARHFVCMRIDVQDDPRWMGAFQPLKRMRRAQDPGFQIYFLDSDGRVFADAGELGYGPSFNAIEFTGVLQNAAATYEAGRAGDPTVATPGEEQASERESIYTSVSAAVPDFQAHYERVISVADFTRGGFPLRGVSRLNPGAHKFLLDADRCDEFRSITDPLARGAHVDWLDGGFFDQVWFVARRQVGYDKLGMRNAEMMEMFATAARQFSDAFYLEVARRSFDSLSGEFIKFDVPAAARIGDETPDGRSARSSISVIDLRRTMLPQNREWARRYLGLRVETNPSMNIQMPHPDVLNTDREKFELLMTQIRSTRVDNRQFTGIATCESASFITARLLATARLLGDPDRREKALRIWRNIQEFRAGEDVRRTLKPDLSARASLADYLAFSDACLQAFLLLGDPTILTAGRKILLRADFLFHSDTTGIWLPDSQSVFDSGPPTTDLPELGDYVRESTTSMAIRLCTAYGRTRRNEQDKVASEESVHLYQLASNTINQIADDSQYFGANASSYFSSSLEFLRGGHIAVVGPNATGQATDLKRQLPGIFIFPAIGSVRLDLQSKGPGYYWMRHATTNGPFTKEEVIARASSERPGMQISKT